jgi:8-oxo-dGTP pyrophosphatase MutT (NUDIX family)
MVHIRQHSQELLTRYLKWFPRESCRYSLLQEQLENDPDPFSRSNMIGHITSSAAILSASGTEILLIHHAFLGKWITPGGHYEGSGSLFESALREVEEETGVIGTEAHSWTIANTIPLDIDTHEVPPRAMKCEGTHFHHDFLFLAKAPADARLKPQLSEVHDAAWFPIKDLAKSPDKRVRLLCQKLLSINAMP